MAGREVLLVDLAVPRDIEPAAGRMPGVALYDVDDLKDVVNRNLEARREKAVPAEAVVDREVNKFMRWLGGLFVIPTITALKRQAEAVRVEELQKAVADLGLLDEHDHRVVATLASTIVNRLLHEPVTRLKDYAPTPRGHLYSETLQNPFHLAVERGAVEPSGLSR